MRKLRKAEKEPEEKNRKKKQREITGKINKSLRKNKKRKKESSRKKESKRRNKKQKKEQSRYKSFCPIPTMTPVCRGLPTIDGKTARGQSKAVSFEIRS